VLPVPAGPGADDYETGIAVLLETARILVKTPMPATIIFAAFTGEEAGDLGSHEFVRQAQEKKMQLLGAINNDMIGWTNDHRLDNTIRYTNDGIRALQHAAAFLFSKMITYDSRYYKSTVASCGHAVPDLSDALRQAGWAIVWRAALPFALFTTVLGACRLECFNQPNQAPPAPCAPGRRE
jgi:Zn-dependent M28 family amino/carboxypeptidase